MTDATPNQPATYSVGHSNRTIEHFLSLLGQHDIDVLVDVRSHPYSRYCPHFSKPSLEAAVRDAGRRYLYMGDLLGGMPDNDEVRDESGRVDYARVAASESFQVGLERLISGSRRFRVAFMCAEEDPLRCHRYHLITCALRDRRVAVAHIRGDGRIESDADLQARQLGGSPDQPTLF